MTDGSPRRRTINRLMSGRAGMRGCVAAAMAALSILCFGDAEADPIAASTCIYASKAYSEGAHVCAGDGLMQACAIDAGHPVWKIVPERDLSARCTAPQRPRLVQRTFHPHRRHAIADIVAPQAGAKCFFFNGRRYCE